MPKYELLISAYNQPGIDNIREGDVLAIRPYPWNWGLKEIDECLVVIVRSSESIQTLKSHHEMPLYQYGLDKRPEKMYVNILAEHRYQLPFESLRKWIPDIDLNKIKNMKYIYQPFKEKGQLVKKFDGKNKRKKVNATDIDCTCSIASDSHEFCIPTDETIPIIWDKYKENFVSINLKKVIQITS